MKRLLLVEDDVPIRRILALVLSRAGYEVVEEGTVAGALTRLSDPELGTVVLDLRLPNGHGRRVVESLKAIRDDVPVVILSAYPDETLVSFPVTAILHKPTNRSLLLEAVAKARPSFEAIKSLRRSVAALGEILAPKPITPTN
jgi:DNA-binding response OmpR family regulator